MAGEWQPTREQIEEAGAAIANARGGRRGMPPITNILALLPDALFAEVMEDAEAALRSLRIGWQPIEEQQSAEQARIAAIADRDASAHIARLQAIEKAARRYFDCYCADEAHDATVCSFGQHLDAVALKQALDAPEPATPPPSSA